jgi:hypothetical protein
MKDRLTIGGRDGAFGAYIARPTVLPAPGVVVLHEVFGVNADIRKTRDELADKASLRSRRTRPLRSRARSATIGMQRVSSGQASRPSDRGRQAATRVDGVQVLGKLHF